MLEKAKLALRLTTDAYDDEIYGLIEAAKLDLGIAGVTAPDDMDALYQRAILTYVRAGFGSPDDYDRLKASYDEQKAQLMASSGHTDWGEAGC